MKSQSKKKETCWKYVGEGVSRPWEWGRPIGFRWGRRPFLEAWGEGCQSAVGMEREGLDALLKRYRFMGKVPLYEDVFGALERRPKVLERKTIYERIVAKLKELVRTFDDDMGDL